jgi:cation:H+ antiporter
MERIGFPQQLGQGSLLILAAAAALYLASRVILGALTHLRDSPGRRAMAQWLPIAVVSLVAAAMDEPELAVGVVFATSLACLTLVLGVVAFYQPIFVSRGSSRPVWGLVLPVALLALLAGFAGEFKLIHGAVLAVEGLVIWQVWHERDTVGEQFLLAETADRHWVLRGAEVALAILLAGLGAWAVTRGVVDVSNRVQIISPGLMAATMVSPLLVLPMLGAAASTDDHGEDTTTSLVGVVLLNLCLLMPAVVFLWHAIGYLTGTRKPLPFPMAVWRMDTVLLIVIGLALLGASRGGWRLDKREGLVLIVLYCAHFFVSSILGIRV